MRSESSSTSTPLSREGFEVGARGSVRMGIGNQVVDRVLAVHHPVDVLLKADVAGLVFTCRGREPIEFQQLLPVCEVLAGAFLEHLAELVPERLVVLGFLVGHGFQPRQNPLGERRADTGDTLILLEDLPGDVQRQLAGVDHALDPAQVEGQELFGIVHDEHALHVQFQAARRFPVPEVEGGVFRQIEQARVFQLALHPVVAPGQGILEIVRDVLVERLVLVVADLGAGTAPQRLGLVDGFQFRLRLGCGFFFVIGGRRILEHAHGHGDVVGVLAHQVAQAVRIGKVQRILAQVQDDPRTATGIGILYRELVLAPGHPARALARAGGAGEHLQLIGNDEGAVEADAELADQVGVFLLVAGELRKELGGTRLGDGAELLDGLFRVMPMPLSSTETVFASLSKRMVIANSSPAATRSGSAMERKRNLSMASEALEINSRRNISRLGVQGVDHQLEKLPGFGLEAVGFRLCRHGWGPSCDGAPVSG